MIFIAFCVLLGYIAYMGYINGYKTGNYEKLGAVYDADGKLLIYLIDRIFRK